MAYEFDVFVSYRRYGEWPHWVEDIFIPLFFHWLGEELGKEPEIFVDYEIETGVSWPQRLGNALGRARILVSLFSRQYFSSPWCRCELAHMLSRESACNLRSAACPMGLVVPAHIHDGEDFPHQVLCIQAAKLQQYTNVRVSKGSLTEEMLSNEIRKWVPDIARAIRLAPAYDPAWTNLAITEFLALFNGSRPVQSSPPSLA